MDPRNLYSVYFLVLIATVISVGAHRIRKRSETCILPPYPDHGTYQIAGDHSAKPGNDVNSAFLNVTCSKEYGVDGNNVVSCVDGVWSTKMPQCVRFCRLTPHPSVEYNCVASDPEKSRPCNEYEPLGTIVNPQCRSPNYYHAGHLPHMRCIDGAWDYVAVCSQECGTISESTDLIIGDKQALPWHADIYRKTKDTNKAICSGSIISSTIIVSAAHCFWNTVSPKIKPSNFAVMVGKTHHRSDVNEQKYLVSNVKIPRRFQGASANFQEDIALVILSSPIVYSALVRPVCVDFDLTFQKTQLKKGNLGKLAVWSDPKDKGDSLQVLELPYIPVDECISKSPYYFREYITADKMCAGHSNGTAICTGNSGGGISFPDIQRGVTRYYLRGVVSTSPSLPDKEICDPVDMIAFTEVNKHENFLKQYFVQ